MGKRNKGKFRDTRVYEYIYDTERLGGSANSYAADMQVSLKGRSPPYHSRITSESLVLTSVSFARHLRITRQNSVFYGMLVFF